MFPSKNITIFALLFSTFLFLPGCGGDRPKTVKVSGKIEFKGFNIPDKGGFLYFAPVNSGMKRPTASPFDKNGNFQVSTYEKNDGLIPGVYKITLECLEHEISEENPIPRNLFPEKYTLPTETPLEITVVPGKEQFFNLVVEK
ncbi:MAG: hypothetical protein Q4C96_07940 [Planctomycetia bacterium]|nr:hypothetical protein [Planctomycetia bacterium]